MLHFVIDTIEVQAEKLNNLRKQRKQRRRWFCNLKKRRGLYHAKAVQGSKIEALDELISQAKLAMEASFDSMEQTLKIEQSQLDEEESRGAKKLAAIEQETCETIARLKAHVVESRRAHEEVIKGIQAERNRINSTLKQIETQRNYRQKVKQPIPLN